MINLLTRPQLFNPLLKEKSQEIGIFSGLTLDYQRSARSPSITSIIRQSAIVAFSLCPSIIFNSMIGAAWTFWHSETRNV